MNYKHFYDLLEAVYILYMFIFFKTKYSFHSFLEFDHVSDYLIHPSHSKIYNNKICKFGKHVAIILALWILFGQYIIKFKYSNIIIFGIVLFFSLFMNMNAFVYILPVFIYECFKLIR